MPFHRQRALRHGAIAAAALLAAGGLAVALSPPAEAGSTTLAPSALTTTSGRVGSGQTVSNLRERDLSGRVDGWNRYVELIGAYTGYLTFNLPPGTAVASGATLRVELNYRGPATRTQGWAFRLYEWSSGTWLTAGTNAAAPDWGDWTLLSFDAPSGPTRYISASGELRLQLAADNSRDAADLDYAALVLGATVAPGPSATTAAPGPATAPSPSTSPTQPTPTPAPTTATAADPAPPPTTTPDGLPGPAPCPACWHPPLRVSWDWVLSVVPHAPYRDVQMYDIDGFEASATAVSALHAAGKKVVCYFSAGSYEEWRPDAGQFPAGLLGHNLDGWPGERWLDIRQIQAADSPLAHIMDARIDMCRAKGFDAVEFDNVDGYTNGSGFPLSAKDQLAYNIFLANAAHARGLAATLKNDVDQISQLEPYYDMALNEECNAYGECAGYHQFVRDGKPVFNAEYGSSTSFCAADNAANINGVRFALDLDGSVYQPCR